MNAPDRIVLTGIRAAIIDLDGTMLHTAPDFHVAVNRMRVDLRLPPLNIVTITDFVGKGTENLIRRVLGVDFDPAGVEEHFPQALDAYLRHYHEINGDYSTKYPDVEAGLAALKAKGLRLACVTNKPIAFAVPLLEKTALRHFFDVVYGGDSLPRKKPDPYPFQQVCRDFDLQPHQTVAIGDSSNDAQAARAAGCRVLAVPYGYNHGQSIHEVDSDGIVSTLLEAANLISA
ncbi:MAG TPA: phosphoglycolate phosphatase [Noviherbaspirillum sp.]|jgi:phosphoglycolate phosphatase|uniref:phosphoglycolate phosphatase n=1 Tax=Noviherbaspirillum sp. TaxID=1926288 RepID=UPI002DDD93C1|nr:phosphoglycolate phosphatase [Noviherbaspirillum sp.]HEV2612344.1 phosphoglycolate phosphatase [Noviherbaspirillum sp.]